MSDAKVMRSPCCNAAVYVRGDDGATKWYACAKCREACDPVEVKEEGK